MKREHENPAIKDKVTFIKLSDETNGEYTLGEFELSPKGGNPPHYHDTFQERFEVLEGELTVSDNGRLLVLKPGDSFVVPPRHKHNFMNHSNSRVKFLVELKPGQPGFEKAIAIAYGLAKDGLTTKKGLPKKLSHMAILTTMSSSRMPGVLFFLGTIFRYIASRAEKRGETQKLIQRYCQ
jgi:quercetin dioxygenase-like cupin family protein